MNSFAVPWNLVLTIALIATISECETNIPYRNFGIYPFGNYSLEYLDKRDYTLADIKLITQVQNVYQQRSQIRDAVMNISAILNVLKESHCHVLIDNFHNLDISPEYVGVVQRRLKLAVYKNRQPKFDALNISRLLWIPHGIQFARYNSTFFDHKTKLCKVDCRQNNYFGGALFYMNPRMNSFCAGVNFFLYAASSRPWNCQIQISLQVHPMALQVIGYPAAFHYDVSIPVFHDFRLVVESMVPKLHIFLQQEKFTISSASLTSFLRAQTATSIDRKLMSNTFSPLVSTTIILLVTFAEDSESPKSIYLITNHFEKTDSMQSSVMRQGTTVYALVSLLKSSPTENGVRWNFRGWSHVTGSTFLILNKMNKCQTRLDSARMSGNVAGFGIVAYDEIFAAGIASLIFSIFPNSSEAVTFDNKMYQLCRNGKGFSNAIHDGLKSEIHVLVRVKTIYKNDPNYLRLTYNDRLSKLAFLSCGGGRGKVSAGMDEFVNIYDTWVWVCLLVALLVAARINRQFLAHSRHSRDVISYIIPNIKVLLEQGDPFASSYEKCVKLRISMTAFLFAGIVLSNGYKNENVYNMIAARQLIPYTRFSELVEDGFKVLTRIGDVYFDSNPKSFTMITANISQFEQKLQMYANHTVRTRSRNYIVVRSEVLGWTMEFERVNKETFFHKLKANTSLHEDSLAIVAKTIIKYLSELTRPEVGKYFELHNAIVAEILRLQDMMLWKYMKSCNKSAIILPSFIAKQYANKLLQEHHDYRIYVDDEDYHGNISVGFALEGALQPNMIKRVQGLQSSGLWNWWSKFMQERSRFIPVLKKQTLEKPSMHGNASLIFSALFAGILLSSILFAFEMRKFISQFFVFVFNHIVIILRATKILLLFAAHFVYMCKLIIGGSANKVQVL